VVTEETFFGPADAEEDMFEHLFGQLEQQRL
jgi:hypothetical protein